LQEANPGIATTALPVGCQLRLPAGAAASSSGTAAARSGVARSSEYRAQYDADRGQSLAPSAVPRSAGSGQTPLGRTATASGHRFRAVRPVAERVGYTVMPGETIASICQRYGLTQERLRAINDGLQGEVVTGQRISLEIRMLEEEDKHDADIGWEMGAWTGNERSTEMAVFGNRPGLSDSWEGAEEAIATEPLWTHATPVREGYERIQLVHTVKEGETLSSIAQKYNTTPEQVKQWNRGKLEGGYMPIGSNLVVGLEEVPLQQGARANAATPPAIGPKRSGPGGALNTEYAQENGGMESLYSYAYTEGDHAPVGNGPASVSGGGLSGVPAVRETAQEEASGALSYLPKPEAAKAPLGLPEHRKSTLLAVPAATSTTKYGEYGAWHPTAREGSYLKITHAQTGKSFFAKVVGRPSGTAGLELTPAVCKQLEAEGQSFEVIVEYTE
jgi:LysM repeat protein